MQTLQTEADNIRGEASRICETLEEKVVTESVGPLLDLFEKTVPEAFQKEVCAASASSTIYCSGRRSSVPHCSGSSGRDPAVAAWTCIWTDSPFIINSWKVPTLAHVSVALFWSTLHCCAVA